MLPRLSIIITSYNYRRFVAPAIDSALAVEWPDKEIIVVDDGSTDGSRSIIRSYADRVQAIHKENGGQITAANVGFAASTGALIIFLDADDMLLPTVGRAVAGAFRPGTAKLQYPLINISADGRPLGSQSPNFTARHSPEWAKETLDRTGFYLAPPTSGNAWSRNFLNEVFPLAAQDRPPVGRPRTGMFDDYLSLLAPYFGDVISLVEPQAMYRWHGANKSGIADKFSLEQCVNWCEDQTERVRAAAAFLRAKSKIAPGETIDFERFLDHVEGRLLFKRFAPRAYLYRDNLGSLFLKYCRSVLVSDMERRKKPLYVAWAALVAFSPRQISYKIAMTKMDKGWKKFVPGFVKRQLHLPD
ncbi:MAG TPA: glycosyltransferase family 2 protein [Stellaceae bacterium]|nr:glycosyltransferase family 2 protein [Stellaceae bacterium]